MRRLIVTLITVGLAVGLSVVAPLSVSAAPRAAFQAGGSVCLVAEPVVVSVQPTPTGVSAVLTGEKHQGGIVSSPAWPELAGASLDIDVNREKADFDLGLQTFTARMNGDIRVETLAYGVLSGKFRASVAGKFFDPTNLETALSTIYFSSAEIDWSIRGDGIKAKGHASAPSFTPTVISENPFVLTLCSPIFFDGTFGENGK